MLTWLSDQEALPKWETAGQTLMKIQMWKQMGLTEYEAINGIAFVNGRMAIWGEVMVWMIVRAWYNLTFPESTAEKCTVKFEKNGNTFEETFTFEEAKNAGWTTKGFVWKNQPKLMLRYKAIRQGAKFFCPHVLGGMITAEEAQTEIMESAEVKEAQIEQEKETFETLIQEIESAPDEETLKKYSSNVKSSKSNAVFQAYATKMASFKS